MTTLFPESTLIKDRAHIPCPCGKSSDAYSEYTDGHGYCFSCSTYFKNDGGVILDSDNTEPSKTPLITSSQYVPFRNVSKETNSFYKVISHLDNKGNVVKRDYPYKNKSIKTRVVLPEKGFYWNSGKASGLFGLDLFDPGSKRSITIVEGEEDALAAYEALNGVSACVSVQSSSSAKADCIAERDKINSFDRIYLCFDNDTPGQKASEQVASLFDFNKVYHVKLNKYKDASDYVINKESENFRNAWYASKRIVPEGIVSSYDEFKEILDDKEGDVLCTYPFPELQRMFRGIREGEIVLIDGLEGLGKTEILRAIEYHILENTDLNLGQIHLEEPKKRQLQGLAGLFMKEPVHFNEKISNAEIMEVIRTVTKRDNRLHLYSHFGSDDPNIIVDRIRFMVSVLGCKVITLDHITMVVTGLDTDDERRVLDQLSTRLAMLCQELNFALIMISHINDDGQTRGSRNISKIANSRITLDRDLQSEDDIKRNTTSFIVKKNRFGATTGFGGAVYFDESTFTLKPVGKTPPSKFDNKVPF